jgi:hypothetical protein
MVDSFGMSEVTGWKSRRLGDEGPDFGDVSVTGFLIHSFEVEAQERFGVGRTKVEPPCVSHDRTRTCGQIDGETVKPVLFGIPKPVGDEFDDRQRVGDLGVEFTGRHVTLVGPANF